MKPIHPASTAPRAAAAASGAATPFAPAAKKALQALMLLAGLAAAPHALADATFYEHDGFQGRSLRATTQLADFGSRDFNDLASSVSITGDPWQLCRDERYSGECVVLQPGRYASLREFGFNDRLSSARRLVDADGDAADGDRRPWPVVSPPGPAQLVLFEDSHFGGRQLQSPARARSLGRLDFDDTASSAVVLGERWEVCDGERWSGRCLVLRPGRYATLTAMGLGDRIRSARVVPASQAVAEGRYAPEPLPVYDSRRRGNERLYEVPILSSRAVLATSGERCWVEAGTVAAPVRAGPNVGGALVGALLGGILGHQVGGGSGKDIATVGGAVVGAAVGSQVGRDDPRGGQATADVRRCESVPGGAQAAYWEVDYRFRGEDHHVQLASPPGRTIRVNARGQPRT